MLNVELMLKVYGQASPAVAGHDEDVRKYWKEVNNQATNKQRELRTMLVIGFRSYAIKRDLLLVIARICLSVYHSIHNHQTSSRGAKHLV